MTAKPLGQWSFIGCDPGVTCGLAWGTFTRWIDYQTKTKWELHGASCDAGAYFELLSWKLATWGPGGENRQLLLCVEKFVTAGARGQTGKDADLTRNLVADTIRLAESYGVKVSANRATDVKPWANDKRLEKVGFPLAPKLKDSRDGGRHILFGAVKSGIADDPLA